MNGISLLDRRNKDLIRRAARGAIFVTLLGLALNAAILAGAVWLVVLVLKATGVL